MGNSLVKNIPAGFITKFVAVNGAIDVLVGLNSLLVKADSINAVNASLALPSASPYSKRSTAYLIFTIGLMRILAYFYPKELSSQVSAYWSYFVEATWMLTETVLHGTTSNLSISFVLYVLGFIVRGNMKRQIKGGRN
jgi:hypothetical protein